MTLCVRLDYSDIRSGRRSYACQCPVALAINRAAAKLGMSGARVGREVVSLWDLGEIPLPEAVRDWVAAYDAGGNPGSIEFTLVFPDKAA